MRSRGHDQDVRAVSLPEKPRPMRHAESVLLVDDDQSEPPELDRSLDQGVRADQDVHVSPLERGEEFPPLAASDPAREEPEAGARPLHPTRQALRVLFRQDFRGRHQSALDAVSCRQQEGEPRHNGLSASDVALEEPRHRSSRREVGGDLADRPFLRAGQLEGKRGPRARPEGVVRFQDETRPLAKPGALLLDSGREREQLFAHEGAPRGRRFFDGGRKMHRLEGATEGFRRSARCRPRAPEPV